MKSITLLALVAAATLGYASPVPGYSGTSYGSPPPTYKAVGGGGSGGSEGSACSEPWCKGLPLPPAGLTAWPINGFPQGSKLNNGGLEQAAGQCGQQQKTLSCCTGDDSSSASASAGGLIGSLLDGLLPSGSCALDLLSPQCSRNLACCDTTGGGLITIGGLCQLIVL